MCTWDIGYQTYKNHGTKWQRGSYCLSIVELWSSSSLSTGCVVSLRGDWAIFCHAGSGQVGIVWSARKKSLEILCHGWVLNPGYREDSELFHWAIMTQATGKTDRELSHWAIMARVTGRTDSELSHWAIVARATERTDSEIHSFSRWAIMTRATQRTDSEIRSFSHSAIMTDFTLHQSQWIHAAYLPCPILFRLWSLGTANSPKTHRGKFSSDSVMWTVNS